MRKNDKKGITKRQNEKEMMMKSNDKTMRKKNVMRENNERKNRGKEG